MSKMLKGRLQNRRHKGNMVTSTCNECGGTIIFKEDPVKHELVRCPDCGAELEVTSVDPIALELAPTEEEDWGE